MNEKKDALHIVSEIDDILRDVWKHLENPQELSQDILKLAVLNGGLGNWYAEAQDNERRLEAHYKHDLNSDKLAIMATEKDERGKAVSATYAESKALMNHWTTQLELLDAEHTTTVLKLKRQDTDQAIDAARSRLSLIKRDMGNA